MSEALVAVHVVARVGPWVVALPTDRLLRMSLASDVRKLGNVLVAGERGYAVWSLGTMLGLRDPVRSVALLEFSHAGRSLPVALELGECLRVERQLRVRAAPPALFARRVGAFTGAFVGEVARVGWVLDLGRLWTAAELDESARRCEAWESAVRVT